MVLATLSQQADGSLLLTDISADGNSQEADSNDNGDDNGDNGDDNGDDHGDDDGGGNGSNTAPAPPPVHS